MKIFVKIMVIGSLWMSLAPFNLYCAEQKDYSPQEIVSMLKNGDKKVQGTALNALFEERDGATLKAKYKTDEIKNALFGILSSEIKVTDSFSESYELQPLAFGIMRLMGFFQDTRALPYMINNVKIAHLGLSLAMMGEPAVEPMVVKLRSANSAEMWAAINYFEIILSTKGPTINAPSGILPNPYRYTYTPDGVVKEKIRTALKERLNDSDSRKSFHAIKILRLIGNPEDKSMLDDAYNRNPNRETPEKKAWREKLKKDSDERRRKENAERKRKGLPSLEEEEDQKFLNFQGD